MNNEIGIGAYFHENAPAQYNLPVINRTINALRRRGIATMDELCAWSKEEIERTRALGEKSLGLVRIVLEKYNEEKGR